MSRLQRFEFACKVTTRNVIEPLFYSIKFNPLPSVLLMVDEADEVFTLDNKRGSVDTWVEGDTFRVLEVFVDEDNYVMVSVVDKSERRNRTWEDA